MRLREKEIGGGGREEEVDSQCYYSMMMRSTLSRSLVTLDRQELDGSLQHGSEGVFIPLQVKRQLAVGVPPAARFLLSISDVR